MRGTCPGSQQPPKGEPVQLGTYRNPRGICARCAYVYPLRADGTLIVHRRNTP